MSPFQTEQGRVCILLGTATPILARGFRTLAAERSEIQADVCEPELTVLLEKADQTRPAVVILDTTSQVDFASITELRRRFPQIAVVLWTDSISVEVAHHAKAAGVRGIIRKDVSEDILIRCICTVSQGELWFERSLMNSLLQVREVRLSPRERQLLRLVAQGLSNKQLAAELSISEGTVKVYLAKLFRKVGVHDRYELAMHGLRSLGLAGMHGGSTTNMNFTSSLVVEANQRAFGHYDSSTGR
jgi:DNA-binding NarL/FixJ family response regulator